MVLITIVTGAYKPTYNWGPHIDSDRITPKISKNQPTIDHDVRKVGRGEQYPERCQGRGPVREVVLALLGPCEDHQAQPNKEDHAEGLNEGFVVNFRW